MSRRNTLGGARERVAIFGNSCYTATTIGPATPMPLIVLFLLLLPVPADGPRRTVPDSAPAGSQPVPAFLSMAPPPAVISEGEDLLYEVRWSAFKLGTIRFKTLKTIREDSTETYSAVAFIDSYAGLPFVNLHALTYTELDSALTSRGAQSMEKRRSRWWVLRYLFDPPTNRIFVEESWQEDVTAPPATRKVIDTLTVDMHSIEDSFSLAFFARAHARSHESVTLPLLVYGKVGLVHLTFTGERTAREIDAVEYPVRVLPVEGHLDVEGMFGMTGDFEGWFSDDDAAVPILARLNVILGSVTVELKEWSRKGWSPPPSN